MSLTIPLRFIGYVALGIVIIAFGLMFTRRRPMRVPFGIVIGISILWIAVFMMSLLLRTDNNDLGLFVPIALVFVVFYFLRRSFGDAMVVNVSPEEVEQALVDVFIEKRVAIVRAPRKLTVPSMGASIEIMYLAYQNQVNLMIKIEGDKQPILDIIGIAIERLERSPSKVRPLFGIYCIVFGILAIALGFLY